MDIRWKKLLQKAKVGQQIYYENQYWKIKEKKGRKITLKGDYQEIKLIITKEGYPSHSFN